MQRKVYLAIFSWIPLEWAIGGNCSIKTIFLDTNLSKTKLNLEKNNYLYLTNHNLYIAIDSNKIGGNQAVKIELTPLTWP